MLSSSGKSEVEAGDSLEERLEVIVVDALIVADDLDAGAADLVEGDVVQVVRRQLDHDLVGLRALPDAELNAVGEGREVFGPRHGDEAADAAELVQDGLRDFHDPSIRKRGLAFQGSMIFLYAGL